jgi:hypothetical protein
MVNVLKFLPSLGFQECRELCGYYKLFESCLTLCWRINCLAWRFTKLRHPCFLLRSKLAPFFLVLLVDFSDKFSDARFFPIYLGLKTQGFQQPVCINHPDLFFVSEYFGMLALKC